MWAVGGAPIGAGRGPGGQAARRRDCLWAQTGWRSRSPSTSRVDPASAPPPRGAGGVTTPAALVGRFKAVGLAPLGRAKHHGAGGQAKRSAKDRASYYYLRLPARSGAGKAARVRPPFADTSRKRARPDQGQPPKQIDSRLNRPVRPLLHGKPRQEKRKIPAQNTAKECWPQSTNGLAAGCEATSRRSGRSRDHPTNERKNREQPHRMQVLLVHGDQHARTEAVCEVRHPRTARPAKAGPRRRPG